MYFILSKLFRKLVIIRIFWVGLRAMGYAGLWDYGAGHGGLRRAAAGMAGRGWAGLGLGVDGARKKWHSLVCAFSPLGHLAAWILIKMVLILVPWVCRARRRPLTPGFHTMFSHHSACGRSFCERNITDLAFKDLKKSTNLLQNLFSVFSFFLLFTWKFRQKTKAKLSI